MKRFKNILLLVMTILLGIVMFNNPVKAEEDINIYFFYDPICLHCHEELLYLQDLETEYDNIKINYLDVVNVPENATLFQEVKDVFDQSGLLTPYTVIGGVSLAGFNDNTSKDLETMIDYYTDHDYVDITAKVINGETVNESDFDTVQSDTIIIPFIGEVNKADFSLILGAILIGFVDGFNPCALWILLFLMTMLIGMKNRKRMWLFGLTFILTSGIVYGIIMMTWLQTVKNLADVAWLRTAIGIVALVLGTYNVYTFIKSLKDQTGCEVTNETRRQKLMNKIKNVVRRPSVWFALGGIIVISATVNIIEFACSAGLPLVYAQLLAFHDLPFITYFIYILIYLLFFLMSEIIIFAVAMIGSRVAAISNKYTRYTHIIGAIIMIIFGILIIFAPNILMFN